MNISIDFPQLKSIVQQCNLQEKLELLSLLAQDAFASKLNTIEKTEKITHDLGIEPQIIKANETVIKKAPQFGFAKGTFIMTDDFDEPLDEFKDYS